MTETTEIHRFKAGDDVPSWLVAFTPQSEDAVRGTITFERNTAVVKVDGVYWLLCLDSPHMQAVIRIDNANKVLTSDRRAMAISLVSSLGMSGGLGKCRFEGIDSLDESDKRACVVLRL